MALDRAIDSAQLDADLTAVADAIRAKGGTSEALAFPGGFVEAVGAIQAGSGGSGNAIQIGQTTPLGILNLFYVLENGAAVTGEFTVASPLPSGSNLMFSTGLETLNGLFIVDADRVRGELTASFTYFAVFIPYGNDLYLNIFCSNAEGVSSNNATSYPKLERGDGAFENGDFYVSPHFGGNASYTPFQPNHRYIWVAW